MSFNDRSGLAPSADTTEKLHTYEKRYLEQVIQECGTLHTEGVDRVTAPLTDVFVMLEALKIPPREIKTDVPPTSEQDQEMGLKERIATALGSHLPKGEKGVDLRPPPSPVPLPEILQRHRHLVILGDPGSGKTTTLQCVALCFAEKHLAREKLGLNEARVPVRGDLRSYDSTEPLGEFLVKAVAALGLFDPVSAQSSQEIAKALLRNWLSEGRLAVLLDGLDEVPEGRRATVAEAIVRFARTNEGQSCRVVVATRIAGYRTIGELGKPFYHYTIRPFAGPEDALPYVSGWLRILVGANTEEDVRDEAWAMLNEMGQRNSLQKVVGNPLLLRLAVTLYTENGELTKNRAELYRRFVDEVLEKRERARGIADTCWTRQQIERSLEAVAWALQNEGQKTVSQLAKVAEQEMTGLPDFQALVSYLRERLGLLVTYGYEQGELVSFRHLTFREFFVARRLARAWEVDQKQTWRFLRPRLHHLDWREPILLLAGMIGSTEATKLARRIRNARSPYESELHRDLLLAATISSQSLPETSDFEHIADALLLLFDRARMNLWYIWTAIAWCLLTLCVAPYFTSQYLKALSLPWWVIVALTSLGLLYCFLVVIIADLISSRLIRRARGKGGYEGLRAQIDEALIALGRQRPELMISQMRKRLLHGSPILWPRAARILKALDATDAQITDHLVNVLCDVSHATMIDERLEEGFDNGKLKDLWDGLVWAAVVFLRYLRHLGRGAIAAAAESLGELGDCRPEVIEALLVTAKQALRPQTMWTSYSPKLHQEAVQALGKLRVSDGRVLDLLVEGLGSQLYRVDRSAISGLVVLHTLEPETVENALLSSLASDNERRAESAARALSHLSCSERTVTIWREMLTHQDPWVCAIAARKLQKENLVSSGTLVTQLSNLDYSATWERLYLIEGLGEARNLSASVLSALVEELANMKWSREYYREGRVFYTERWLAREAAMALVSLGQRNIAIVGPALVRTLQNENAFSQEMAAWALGELGYDVPEAVVALERVMDSNTKYCASAPALSRLEEQKMFAWLAAAAALGKLGRASCETVFALLIELQFKEHVVKRSAATALGKLGQADHQIRRALEQATLVPDPQVMEAAVLSLQNLGYEGITVVRKLLTSKHATTADGAHRLLEQLVAQQTEAQVERLSTDLLLPHRDGADVMAKKSPVSRRHAAISVLVSTFLGLVSNIAASILQELFRLNIDPVPMVITIAVFAVSLVVMIGWAWRTGETG